MLGVRAQASLAAGPGATDTSRAQPTSGVRGLSGAGLLLLIAWYDLTGSIFVSQLARVTKLPLPTQFGPLSKGSVIALALAALLLRFRHRAGLDRRQQLLLLACIAVLVATWRSRLFEFAGGTDAAGSRGGVYEEMASWVLVAVSVVVAPTLRMRDVLTTLQVAIVLSVSFLFLGEAALSTDNRLQGYGVAGRLTGLFGHPNTTGVAAAVLGLLLVANRPARWPAWLALAGCTLALTASIDASIGLLLGLVVLGLHVHRARFVLRLVGPATVAVAVLLPYVFSASTATSAGLHDFSGRGEIWRWCFDLMQGRQDGLGPTVFETYRDAIKPVYWFHAHNQALYDRMTGGLAKEAAVSAVLLAAVLYAGRRAASGSPVGVGASACWLCIATVSAVEIPLSLDTLDARTLLICLLVTALLCPDGSAGSPSGPGTAGDLRPRTASAEVDDVSVPSETPDRMEQQRA